MGNEEQGEPRRERGEFEWEWKQTVILWLIVAVALGLTVLNWWLTPEAEGAPPSPKATAGKPRAVSALIAPEVVCPACGSCSLDLRQGKIPFFTEPLEYENQEIMPSVTAVFVVGCMDCGKKLELLATYRLASYAHLPGEVIWLKDKGQRTEEGQRTKDEVKAPLGNDPREGMTPDTPNQRALKIGEEWERGQGGRQGFGGSERVWE